MSWQPIATAPRDSDEQILVTKEVFGGVWSYSVAAYAWEDAQGHWWQSSGSPAMQPTHWMPLPPPPEAP